ncbi:MAG: hypothetical protein CVV63_01025 [Tenericutes bacterium HGW-Tenericutes-8]|nr:MAG: hypothetical protein CVV63_01025 [Tenericutes bacterium HGW-Tenericutes-8]
MKKAVTYRKFNHHICNLSFIISSIVLFSVVLSQIMHIALAHIFSYLMLLNIAFIIAALSTFLVGYLTHKTYKKLEKVSTVMIVSSIAILIISFVIETALFH